jgi:hypothetical protein
MRRWLIGGGLLPRRFRRRSGSGRGECGDQLDRLGTRESAIGGERTPHLEVDGMAKRGG